MTGQKKPECLSLHWVGFGLNRKYKISLKTGKELILKIILIPPLIDEEKNLYNIGPWVQS